jgi:hypothetical protein
MYRISRFRERWWARTAHIPDPFARLSTDVAGFFHHVHAKFMLLSGFPAPALNECTYHNVPQATPPLHSLRVRAATRTVYDHIYRE